MLCRYRLPVKQGCMAVKIFNIAGGIKFKLLFFAALLLYLLLALQIILQTFGYNFSL